MSGRTPYGWTVTYTQQYQGVDVFGAMLKANLDKAGDLTSVNGYAAPAPEPLRRPADQRREPPATVR